MTKVKLPPIDWCVLQFAKSKTRGNPRRLFKLRFIDFKKSNIQCGEYTFYKARQRLIKDGYLIREDSNDIPKDKFAHFFRMKPL